MYLTFEKRITIGKRVFAPFSVPNVTLFEFVIQSLGEEETFYSVANKKIPKDRLPQSKAKTSIG